MLRPAQSFNFLYKSFNASSTDEFLVLMHQFLDEGVHNLRNFI